MSIKTFEKLTDAQRKELKNGVIEVTGKAMNRTALGVVDAVFTMFPNITFSELKEMLPDEINPSAPKNFKSLFRPFSNRMYGVIQPGSIRKECENQGLDINSSHFIIDDETFKTSDGVEVLVSKVWETADTETKEHNLQNLINHVAQYGIRVTKVEKAVAFNKGTYNLDVINPTLLQAIHNPVIEKSLPPYSPKKKFPWWISILLLLLIAGILFYLTNGKEKEETVSQEEIVLPVEVEEANSLSPLDEIKYQIAAGENTEGKSVSFHEILFEKDSDELLSESEVYLNEVFQIMTDIPALKLLIVGHTSSEGDDNYNLKLSTKRALSVSAYLQNQGINSDRLSTEGKGSASPVSSNETEEGRRLNRRIEFIITDDGLENN
jgi:outer membrane protein OmpA-like peptidoglycan-associated protein